MFLFYCFFHVHVGFYDQYWEIKFPVFYIRNWSHSTTQVVAVVLVGATIFKESLRLYSLKLDWDEIWRECSSTKYGSIDEESDFQFGDSGHDAISHRKVLPPGDCTWYICTCCAVDIGSHHDCVLRWKPVLSRKKSWQSKAFLTHFILPPEAGVPSFNVTALTAELLWLMLDEGHVHHLAGYNSSWRHGSVAVPSSPCEGALLLVSDSHL